MAKITPLDDVANLSNEGSATSVINTNSDRIEEAIEKTLSREGDAPNQMEALLDMNSNPIINLPDGVQDSEPLTVGQGEQFLLDLFEANKDDFKGDKGDKGDDGADGIVASVQAGTNVTVDNTDPANPIVNATAGGGQVDSVVGGTNVTVDNTDPMNPIVNVPTGAGGVQSVAGGTGISMGGSGENPVVNVQARVVLDDESNQFTKGQGVETHFQNPVAGNLTLDAEESNFFIAEIGSNTSVGLPVMLKNGQVINLLLRFTATATVTFGGNWVLAGGNTVNGSNSNVYMVSAIYDGVSFANLWGTVVQVA